MTTIIKTIGLNKQFVVPHQKRTTLKESFINIFRPRTFEKFIALKNINLEISKGEFTAIIGPNGSGKSTLLKVLAQIYQPNQGSIQVNGSIAPLLELGIGFQGELTARENIYLNAALLGFNKKQIHQKFPHIIEFSEIGNFIDLKVKNFSSGMRARLAFAIARELDADIYLCDEVFAVGDQSFQQKCLNTFTEWKAQGKNIILVTHNLDFVNKYADRAIYLANGIMLADGKPQIVIQAYQSTPQ